MSTQALTIGPVHNLLQNVIYALPARNVRVQSTTAVEVSLSTTTTAFAVLANSTTGAETSAAFVRCTTGATTIICKAV